MIFAIYDTDTGRVTNWMDHPSLTVEQINAGLPNDRAAVEADRRIDGPCEVESGVVVSLGADLAELLKRAKARAVLNINQRVGVARLTYITDLPGQSAIYQRKEQEARRWLAEQPDTLDGFPMMQAEVGLTEPDAASLAALWVGLSDQWSGIAAHLEAIRLTATKAINAAADDGEIDAAVQVAEQALAALAGSMN